VSKYAIGTFDELLTMNIMRNTFIIITEFITCNIEYKRLLKDTKKDSVTLLTTLYSVKVNDAC